MRKPNKFILHFTLLIILMVSATSVFAQKQPEPKEKPKPTTRILFIFDASQSMLGRWQSDTKFNIAKRIMSELLDSLAGVKNVELALRIYGHQTHFPPQDCKDTKLEVPFGPDNAQKIKAKLRSVTPRGTTPLAYSLEQSATDFTPCGNCRNIVVLITDGIEECSGDPCAVSRMLQKNGIVLKPFIVGIGQDFNKAFHCVGTYFDATTEKDFKKALDVVISQALNSTTAQVNLLDASGKPTETDVPMTFYDAASGKIMYNFVHTMNNRGVPDTLVLDPLVTYNVVVHTIPPVHADSILITPGKHTIIAADAPQGSMQLKMAGTGNASRGLQCLVHPKGSMEILNVQNFGETEKYITGVYDLQVLSLPRLFIPNVEIKQSHTATIEIPEPGIAVIRKSVFGYGSLMVEDKNQLTWVYNLDDSNIMETLYLQPGTYRIIFRPKTARQTIYTVEQRFVIESGKTTDVQMYK
ncbi:MAG TPA: VWA domain-containing protein [Bacteroidales bacterium]|nr:VWA domain-containing protein [Bacteroidales bacterium]